MNINIIAALNENNVIGKDNTIPWTCKEDMAYFKKLTSYHTVLMGKKTFVSLNCKPLKNRKNIVISRSDLKQDGITVFNNGITVFTNIEDGIEFARKQGESELFIIGGARIYDLSLKYAQKMILTVVKHYKGTGDTFFPIWNQNEWKITKLSETEECKFLTYEKRFTK